MSYFLLTNNFKVHRNGRIFCLCIFVLFIQTSARRLAEEYGEPTPSPPPQPTLMGGASFKPGITVIVAAITSIFTITFILLIYVQHCKTGPLGANSRVSLPLSRVDSGVNKKVIQQLPLFRFSSLRGQKDGLECSVCLTRFEPEEVLRLLPKCRHAFHADCVDTWLDEHSTCPLCRYRVRPEDILLIDCHGSNRKTLYNYDRGAADSRRGNFMNPGMFSARHSSAGERSGALDRLGNESRRRFSFDSRGSRRTTGGTPSFSRRSLSRRDERLAVQGDKHRLEHQIVVSDCGEGEAEEGKSDVKEEEVLFLRTELLLDGGDGDEEEGSGSGSGRALIDDRSAAAGMRKNKSDVGERKGKEREEEGIGKRLLDWLPQFQLKPAASSAAATSSSSSI